MVMDTEFLNGFIYQQVSALKELLKNQGYLYPSLTVLVDLGQGKSAVHHMLIDGGLMSSDHSKEYVAKVVVPDMIGKIKKQAEISGIPGVKPACICWAMDAYVREVNIKKGADPHEAIKNYGSIKKEIKPTEALMFNFETSEKTISVMIPYTIKNGVIVYEEEERNDQLEHGGRFDNLFKHWN